MRRSFKPKHFSTLVLLALSFALTTDSWGTTNVVEGSANGTRHALLIGINYTLSDHPDIAYAHRSVYLLGKALQDYGFPNPHLLVGTAASRSGIFDVLNEVVALCREEDELLVFFVGHGVRKINRDGSKVHALLASDCGVEARVEDLVLTRDLVRILQSGRARNTAFILSTCHSGQVIDDVERFRAMDDASRSEGGRSFSIFAASSPTQLAFGNENETSGYFVDALIDGLQSMMPGKAGIVGGRDLHVHAQDYLRSKTAGQQKPQYKQFGPDGFRFVRATVN